MILWQLFISFAQIGLFSIGGGYAAIPLIQSQAVEVHGWLTAEQFMDLATIAEMTPGPIALNAASFVGIQVAGIAGAVIATLGCLLPSLVIVSGLSWIYGRYRRLPMLQSVLGFLRPAVVALIAAAGINMLLQAVCGGRSLSGFRPVAALLFAAAFLALRRFKWSPILVMALCGAAGLVLGLALEGGI